MNFKVFIVLVAVLMMNACASKKKVAEAPKRKAPVYQSAQDLFKNEQCAKNVEIDRMDQPLILKPDYQILNEPSDIFCVQKLKKGQKILKVSSVLEPMDLQEQNPVPDKKFFATVFDLVLYDNQFKQLKLPKPIYRSSDTQEISAYYDFSKKKKFPVYIVILFRPENRTDVIFTQTMLPSKDALVGHSANTAAAGLAMGGFAAGSAASISQPKKPLKYSVYARNPAALKADWVREIPKR